MDIDTMIIIYLLLGLIVGVGIGSVIRGGRQGGNDRTSHRSK